MKLRYYLLPRTVLVISNTDLIKYMLSRPVLRGKIGKWSLALTEFCLECVSQKAIKGQALADFLADHPCPSEQLELTELNFCELVPWKLWFDRSKTRY